MSREFPASVISSNRMDVEFDSAWSSGATFFMWWSPLALPACSGDLFYLGDADYDTGTPTDETLVTTFYGSNGNMLTYARDSGGNSWDYLNSGGNEFTEDDWYAFMCTMPASGDLTHANTEDGGTNHEAPSLTDRSFTNTKHLIIGNRASGLTLNPLDNALVAHVAVWDVQLTSDDFDLLAAGTDPRDVKSANLIAYYPLNDDLSDYSGNDQPDLTITGTCTQNASNPTITVSPSDEMLVGYGPLELLGSPGITQPSNGRACTVKSGRPAVRSGPADEAYVWCEAGSSSDFIVSVYDDSGGLLGSTGQTTRVNEKWVKATFSTPIDIVQGEVYRLCVTGNPDGWQRYMQTNISLLDYEYDDRTGSYPTMPDPWELDSSSTNNFMGCYLASSSGPLAATTALINFYHNTSPGGNWNNPTDESATGTLISNLDDDEGNPTGWSLENDTAWTASYAPIGIVGARWGYPEEVWKNAWYHDTDDEPTITIGGLPVGAAFAMKVLGSPQNASRDSRFVCSEADTTSLLYDANGDNDEPTFPVVFTGTVPAGGEITLTGQTVAGWSYWYLHSIELTITESGEIDITLIGGDDEIYDDEANVVIEGTFPNTIASVEIKDNAETVTVTQSIASQDGSSVTINPADMGNCRYTLIPVQGQVQPQAKVVVKE